MTIINQPKVSVSIVPADQDVTNTEQRILILGQMTTGSATAGALVTNIANGGAEDALFGADSMLALLVRANKFRNQQVRVDAIPLDDDGAATAAAGEIAVTGTATEDGTLTIIAGGEYSYSYDIAVTSGDTATVVGAAIAAAVNGNTQSPVTAINTTGTVAVTATNGGTFGNSIPIEVIGTVAGVATVVTGMAGGATDPTLTSVLDVISEERYQTIVWPYPADYAIVTAFLDARFNADGKVLDGVAITADNNSLANLTNIGNLINSQSLVYIGGRGVATTNYAGGDIVEIPMVKAAQFAAFRALRLDSSGFNIADLVITRGGALDSFGGPALASKPYFNTPFAQIKPIRYSRGFNDTEIEQLKDAGISVLGNNFAGNTVVAGEIVTTYKTDTSGNPDVTFTFLNYVDTASQAREYFFNNYRARYAQSRLTEGDLIRGRSMANAESIAAYSKQLYQDLSGPDFVLLESGEDALKFFVDNFFVTIDKALGKATIQMTVPIVTQLREIAATMKIAFSTNA